MLKAGSLGSFVITRRDSPDDQQMAAAASSSGGKIRLVQTTGIYSSRFFFSIEMCTLIFTINIYEKVTAHVTEYSLLISTE